MLILVMSACFIFEFFKSSSGLDIHLHDTYYVVSNIHLSVVFLAYSLLIYAAYFLLRKINQPVSKSITIIQITGLVVAILASSIPNNIPEISNQPTHYYDYSTWNSFTKFAAINKLVTIAAIVFIASQVVFFLYFIGILIKSLIKRS